MKYIPKIAALSGSIRKDSLNIKLLQSVIDEIQQKEIPITYIDLKNFSIPFYNGDLEESEKVPSDIVKLKKIIEEHDGIMIASPEYNGSISPILKNMIDWVTRGGNSFQGKTALLMSASPSVYGGYRALEHLRFILQSIGVYVLPGQKTLSCAHTAFTVENQLAHEADKKEIEAISKKYIDFTYRLKS